MLRRKFLIVFPFFLHFFLFYSFCSLSAFEDRKEYESLDQKERIKKGPLKISADETISKERGKIIEAKGKVSVQYELETGDTLESFSEFARYDEKEELGELWGKPYAIWKRSDPSVSDTNLQAERILLKIKSSELMASGHVEVRQSSSTLKANEIRFFSSEKKMIAQGGRPQFTIQQPQQHIEINAEEIVAWTEDKKIEFNEKVVGIVKFYSQEPIKSVNPKTLLLR